MSRETGLLDEMFEKHRAEILDNYFQFLRFESISSEQQYSTQVESCAMWLSSYLKSSGFEVEYWKTSGHPTIFAHWLHAGADRPTVLIYNHYDVQPVDPVELWESPPFDPTLRDNQIFARGAQDNKGQCFYVLSALKYLLKEYGSLPVNIKLCIEGEEECGSAGLAGLLKEKQQELKAEYLFIVDVGLREPNLPAVTLGLRGIVTMTALFVGSNTDLHSGSHGGVACNPNHALVEVLAKLHDSEGQVLVPGFYDKVAALDKRAIAKINTSFDPSSYEQLFGAKPFGGEKKYSPLESAWLRPTLEINGVGGGYTGDGFKTVIPAHAVAKLSSRLVPHQEPAEIAELIAVYIKQITPRGIHVEVSINSGGGKGVRTDPDSRVVKAVAQAYSEVFEKPCDFILEGASIPIVPELSTAAGAEVVLMGYGLSTDKIHAPNEHFGLDRFQKGFVTIGRALQILGSSSN